MKVFLDILIELSKTPLPAIVGAVGLLLILVALGFHITGTIETSDVGNITAGVVGVIFLVMSVVIHIAPRVIERWPQPPGGEGKPISRDSFFNYYIISVVLILLLFWMTVAGAIGETQIWMTVVVFGLIAGLIVVLLIWRYLAVRSYLQNRDSKPPIGLLEPTPSFIPYFLLIGPAIIGLVTLTYRYTMPGTASAANRLLIIAYLVSFLIYLAFCRLVWEIIDRRAR